MPINGKQWIYYELHLSNRSHDSIEIQKIEVVDLTHATELITLNGPELLNRWAGKKTSQKNSCRLAANDTGVVYLEFPLPMGTTTVELVHRTHFALHQGITTKNSSVEGAGMKLPFSPSLILGSPLRKGYWAAVYDPSWQMGHRRVFYTVDGISRIPGRFAIDFIRLDSQGHYASQDEDQIKNWYGYGDDVLAAHDGVVVTVRDDFAESATLSNHPDYPPHLATGNYLVIDIGNNRFLFYEHLQPRSIRVKPGQKIKKGTTIASLGFTGQTTGPHLHFHVADKNSPLGAEGIPFVFEQFMYAGDYPDFEIFGKGRWNGSDKRSGKRITGERPAPNSVIRFSPD